MRTFKVGDLVKYIKGESVYKIITVNDEQGYTLRHLLSNKVYNEDVDSRLIKLKFKIGDKVKVVNGSYKKGDIVTIIDTFISDNKIFYKVDNLYTAFLEESLESVTNEFKEGDLVYVDPSKTKSTNYLYKTFKIKATSDKDAVCIDDNLCKHSFNKSILTKFMFQPGDRVHVINCQHPHFGMPLTISQAIFIDRVVEYFTKEATIWYRESDLLTLSEIGSVEIREGIRLTNNINNLNQNQNENQLQGKETSERTGSSSERVGIYGRRAKATIRIGHLGYQTRFGKR